MKHLFTTVASAALLAIGLAGPAAAGQQPFIGQLMLTGDRYCPQGWTDAAGQLLAISQNQALFSLYGISYGGDGRTTFALPNLQTRVVISQGQGDGQPAYNQGQVGGVATTTLSFGQMPTHNHAMNATSGGPDAASPSGGLFATFSPGLSVYSPGGTPDLALNSSTIANAGGSQPFDNRQPYIVLRYCVALQGVYPSRN